MSRFEKLFWLTIVILATIWLWLEFGSSILSKPKAQKPILTQSLKTVIEIIDDNHTIRDNLEKSDIKRVLSENLSLQVENLSQSIDKQIEELFAPIHSRVDSFLDFHYSVIGEYTELGSTATREISKAIQKRIFGDDFGTRLTEKQKTIEKLYRHRLEEYYTKLSAYATDGIDMEINSEILLNISDDISKRVEIQSIKLGSIMGTAVAIKIATTISTKLATKATAKLAVKGVAKATIKASSTGAAAAAGAVCGPLVWICAPVAATVVWFGTDSAIIAGDEYLHRDELKREILTTLDSEKIELKQTIQKHYQERLLTQDKEIKQRLKQTTIKTKVRKTVIEMIEGG